MTKNTITDIGDVERTANYIQAQIAQADEMLAPYINTSIKPIHFAHLLEWKKTLQTELHELRKGQKIRTK